MDYNKLYSDMQETIERIEDEEIGVHFGSKEYDKAKKACQELSQTWESMGEKTKGEKGAEYQMSDYEVKHAREQIESALAEIDNYLDKKSKEAELGKKQNATSTYRIQAMQNARKRLEEQMESMDNLAAERGMERSIPTADQMERQRKNLSTELNQAQENVHGGSSEFKNAQEEYEKLNKLWDKTAEYKNDGELPKLGEIETLRASIERARKAADDYLLKKSDVEKPGPKTQKRITAMSRMKENLDLQSKMLDEWETKLTKQEPEKGYNVLATDTKYLMNQMEAADEGVVGGSREYKEVNELLKKQEEKWKEFEEKGPDYKMTSRETREMQELNEKMEKAVNQYIQNKAGKELSPKEQKRLRTMQKVKDHTLSQKKKLAGNVKEMMKDAQKVSNEELAKNDKEVAQELRNANKKVHFGSKNYSNAMKNYNRSYERWQQYSEREAKGLVTPKDRDMQKKDLEFAIKSIDKYLDSKKDVNLDKNPKTKKRVQAMEKARKNLETRMYKLRIMENKQKSRDNSEKQKEMQQRTNSLRTNTKAQEAFERNAARASLAATQQMTQLGNRKNMTKMDRKNARTALAALVLEERLNQPGQEMLKKAVARNGKTYAQAVQTIANSKEFRQTFPDSKLTPANCKNYATNPRSIKKASKDFNDRLIRNAQAKKQKQNQRQRQAQKQTQRQTQKTAAAK